MNNGLELAGNHEKLAQINLHDILLKRNNTFSGTNERDLKI